MLSITAPFKPVIALVNDELPVTPKVPAIVVLPFAALTVNLFVLISKLPSIPVAPDILTAELTYNVTKLLYKGFTGTYYWYYGIEDLSEEMKKVKELEI